MANGYQKISLIGNLGRAPETRALPSGATVCSFSVAVNDYGDKTEWFNVSAWDKLGEVCQQYLTAGRLVFIEGTVSARAYMGKDGQPACSLDVRASTMKMLGGRGDADAPEAAQGGRGEARGYNATPATTQARAAAPAATGGDGWGAEFDPDTVPF